VPRGETDIQSIGLADNAKPHHRSPDVGSVVRDAILHHNHVEPQNVQHCRLGRLTKSLEVGLRLSTGYGEDRGVELLVAVNLQRTHGVVRSVQSIVGRIYRKSRVMFLICNFGILMGKQYLDLGVQSKPFIGV
jgi:hypothetical protein